jgi:hypothetical protein
VGGVLYQFVQKSDFEKHEQLKAFNQQCKVVPVRSNDLNVVKRDVETANSTKKPGDRLNPDYVAQFFYAGSRLGLRKVECHRNDDVSRMLLVYEITTFVKLHRTVCNALCIRFDGVHATGIKMGKPIFDQMIKLLKQEACSLSSDKINFSAVVVQLEAMESLADRYKKWGFFEAGGKNEQTKCYPMVYAEAF